MADSLYRIPGQFGDTDVSPVSATPTCGGCCCCCCCVGTVISSEILIPAKVFAAARSFEGGDPDDRDRTRMAVVLGVLAIPLAIGVMALAINAYIDDENALLIGVAVFLAAVAGSYLLAGKAGPSSMLAAFGWLALIAVVGGIELFIGLMMLSWTDGGASDTEFVYLVLVAVMVIAAIDVAVGVVRGIRDS